MTLLQTLPAANRFYAGSRLKRASSRAPSRDPVKVTLKLPRLDPSTSLGMTGPLKEFSPFAGQLVKTDFDCELPSGCARNASGREAADSTLEYMPKSRRSLANSIRIVFAPLLLCLFGALPAFATDGIYSKFGLNLGYAGRIGYMGGTTPEWAIYVYGAGTASSRFNALDISSSPDATGLQVDGNIALAGVYSTLTVSGRTSINGDRYEQTTSTELIKSTGTITGSRFSSSTINSQLNSGAASLKNVSIAAAGLTATAGSPTSLNIGKNQSRIFDNTPFGGKYVMNLSSFVMGGGNNGNGGTLTLNGAAGSAFVLNISGAFSLGGNAKILLTGGLTVSDVLFNITGSNSTFTIGGDALFNGTLLAYNSSGAQRTLQITGHNTQINGELLAYKISLQSGAHVKKPKEKSKEKDDDDDVVASNSLLHARTSAK